MLNAVKFLNEKERMCQTFIGSSCRGCPFQEAVQGVTDSCCAYKEALWRTEDYVEVVEKWSKTCPARNNETVFVETFGFDPVSIRFGTKKWYEAWLEAEYKEPSDGN